MKHKILTVLSIITGLLFINGGLNKFLNYMPVPDNITEPVLRDFNAIMEISWLMPLIGLAELVGGLLIIFPKTRALGVLVILPVAVGILLTHLLVDNNGLLVALLIWAILLWILFDNRKKYEPLFNRS